MKTIRFLPVLFALSFAAGCGLASSGSGSLGNNSGPTMQGSWEITATSTTSGSQSYVEANFTQSGVSFSASGDNLITLSLQGVTVNVDPCSLQPTFNGSLNGTALAGTLTEGTQSVHFTGTLSADGKTATGTYQSDAGGCTNGDTGTFSANAISEITGSYSGTLVDGFRSSAPTTIQLTEGANFSLMGTGTVTTQATTHNLSLTGSVVGAFFGGNGTLSNFSPSQIVVAGRVNPSATTVEPFAIGDPTTGALLYTGILTKSSATVVPAPMFQFSAPLPQIRSQSAGR